MVVSHDDTRDNLFLNATDFFFCQAPKSIAVELPAGHYLPNDPNHFSRLL